MSSVDLFGNPVEDYRHPTHPDDKGKKRRSPQPKGYAARPGSGPEGETCKSCDHYCHVHVRSGRHYRKCGVIEWRWTRSAGTDIKASSPACSYWQPKGEGHE